MGNGVRQSDPDSVTQHRFLSIHFLHSLQSGLPPVPARTFSFSTLLPAWQFVHTWCTLALIECHGDFCISDSWVLGGTQSHPLPHSLITWSAPTSGATELQKIPVNRLSGCRVLCLSYCGFESEASIMRPSALPRKMATPQHCGWTEPLESLLSHDLHWRGSSYARDDGRL